MYEEAKLICMGIQLTGEKHCSKKLSRESIPEPISYED